eukprot:TRINITY_DN19173_c0_g1_i1.p2 TRINITY_DN19173_c0_g1~~TRINITY_DN19173_c0_g1_i1.p2  ORF type:complete len:227 (+),score=72.97 TRINITY_DN19173_c0_g1_i1:45-683(+)
MPFGRRHREGDDAKVGSWEAGGAVAAVSGLVLLPIEPITGVSMLSSGLLAMYKGQVDKRLGDIKGELASTHGLNEERLRETEAKLRAVEQDKQALEERHSLLTGAVFVTAVVAVGGLYYLYRRYRHTLPKGSIEVGPDTVSVHHLPPANYQARAAESDNDALCVCCMEHVPDMLVRPCMHVSMCFPCIQRLPSASCPSCRCTFTEIDYVFVA